jgi:hypothetical protein
MSNIVKRCLAEDAVNFCYIDESGTGREPIATMVGILVDSGRMRLTKQDWIELLKILSDIVQRPVKELHTADFYNGNGIWRGMDGKQRSEVISGVLEWLTVRKHHIVYSSVVKKSYYCACNAGELPNGINTPWRYMGFHLALAIQRYGQRAEKNKGNTFLQFDNEERERLRFPDLIKTPPEWSDAYYSWDKKQRRLDQIIDVPAFQDSKEVELLQVADFLAFFLRRHAEIQEGLIGPKYNDEQYKVAEWFNKLQERSIGTAHIYPKNKRTEAHEIFFRHATPSIRR